MYPTRIVIAPWLETREPINFGAVEFLPKDEAMRRWPDAAREIDDVTGYFCTGYAFAYDDFKQRFLDGKRVPMQPAMTKPTVVDCSSDSDLERVDVAFDALAFASMSRSNDGGIVYANAAVFRRDIQNLGGSPFVAHRTRRRSGSQLAGFDVRCRIETRPSFCGSFAQPDPEMLEGLARAVFSPGADRLRSALAVLGQATYDSNDVPPEIEASFYALVAGRLLADPTADDDKIEPRIKRARRLLQPLAPNGGSAIADALRVTNRRRNGVWHAGRARGVPPKPYEHHALIPFALVAFRAVEAVIIGELVALGALDRSSKAATKVRAIEGWIRGIVPWSTPSTGNAVEMNEAARNAMSLTKQWNHMYLTEVIRRIAASPDTG